MLFVCLFVDLFVCLLACVWHGPAVQDDLVDERRHVERNLSLYRKKMEKICCGVFLLWGKEDKVCYYITTTVEL